MHHQCLPLTTRMEASKLHTQALPCMILKLPTAVRPDLIPHIQEVKPARQRHGDNAKLRVGVVFADMPHVK
jgi:hypothetical protein